MFDAPLPFLRRGRRRERPGMGTGRMKQNDFKFFCGYKDGVALLTNKKFK